ncbi:MAG: hypothetical protein ABFD15_03480 [Methanofastidiosum sp.]
MAIIKNILLVFIISIIVHARIKDGIIYPLEKIDIEDKEVLIKIEDKIPNKPAFSVSFDISDEVFQEILENEGIF